MPRNDLLHKCLCSGVCKLVLGRKEFWPLYQVVHEDYRILVALALVKGYCLFKRLFPPAYIWPGVST